jgi:hypothetical protein
MKLSPESRLSVRWRTMCRMGTERREIPGQEGVHYWVTHEDPAGVTDDALVEFVREAARLVVAERPTVEQVSALAAALQEAVDASAPAEEAVASLGVFPQLEAFARNNPALFSLVEKILIGVLLAFVAWGLQPSAAKPSPTPQVVHIEPSEDEVRRIVEEEVHKTQQAPPSSEQPSGRPGPKYIASRHSG